MGGANEGPLGLDTHSMWRLRLLTCPYLSILGSCPFPSHLVPLLLHCQDDMAYTFSMYGCMYVCVCVRVCIRAPQKTINALGQRHTPISLDPQKLGTATFLQILTDIN